MLAGFLLVWKSEWLLNNVGRIDFFESYLSTSGGTRLGYKLIGMASMFIGMLMVTNLINSFLSTVLSPILDAQRAVPIEESATDDAIDYGSEE
jgi:1,4-dihydroxy-2-naphthoate octaprenyltransferase